ncbi:MAG: choice-of-anchor Q domain-containing protein, partial [Bacteroidia bacterium]
YAFYLKGGVEMYGGFAGTETTLGQRNLTNTTILSGDIGTADDDIDNSYHVIISINETATGVLDGFTISSGNANGAGSLTVNSKTINRAIGGGMYNQASSPIINNCTFSNNTGNNGCGMFNAYSNISISNCTFVDNYSSSNNNGGAMYNSSATPSITNCTFVNNEGNLGGAIFNWVSSPSITNSTFSKNVASGNGGAISNYSTSSPTISNSIFWGNTAASSGADIFNQSTTPTITYTTLQVAYVGTGNSTADPLFAGASNPAGADGIHRTGDDGLRLSANSPAANSGSNSAIAEGLSTDIIGDGRIQNTTVNRGAYETLLQPIYVDNNATGNNNGANWNNAYTSLQSAILEATNGDQIWVASGTYKPIALPAGYVDIANNTSTRDNAFYLAGGVEMYGGFSGTETKLSEKDPLTNVTILSGDIGTANDSSDNCYHVLVSANESMNSILDGFTITKGNAAGGTGWPRINSSTVYRYGGAGMYNVAASPSIRNCIFIYNYAESGGGAMRNSDYSKFTISNCNFITNTAAGGGGIYNEFSSVTVVNCVFDRNNTTGSGAGLSNFYSSSRIINSIFSKNVSSSGSGGGINNSYSSPQIINCTFSANSAQSGGGMASPHSSYPRLVNCILWGNKSTYYGGPDITDDRATRLGYNNLQETPTGGSTGT